MMRRHVVLLLLSLLATAAVAGLDPDPDSMGFYFDTLGNTNWSSRPLFTPFNGYLLLMNPTGPVDGFGCAVRFNGARFFILSTTLPAHAVDRDPAADLFLVTEPVPPPVGGACVLVTFSVMLASAVPWTVRLDGIPDVEPCGWPFVYRGGGIDCCGISSDDVRIPVARVNAYPAPLAASTQSFGAVKSLFR